ncbi:MAG: hypothetical protein AAF740_02800 [Bacteroidota bacterium]
MRAAIITIIQMTFIASMVIAQKKQHIGFTLGICNTLSKDKYLQEQNDIYLNHRPSASYAITWYSEITQKLSLELGLRNVLLRTGFRLDNINQSDGYTLEWRKVTLRVSPPQFNINTIYQISGTTKRRFSAHSIFGLALSREAQYVPYERTGNYTLAQSSLYDFEHELHFFAYSEQLSRVNLLFNLGFETQVHIQENHTLALRFLYQLGLRKIRQYDFEYSLHDQTFQNRRFLYGSNLALELSYRIPFRKKRYERKLNQKQTSNL